MDLLTSKHKTLAIVQDMSDLFARIESKSETWSILYMRVPHHKFRNHNQDFLKAILSLHSFLIKNQEYFIPNYQT